MGLPVRQLVLGNHVSWPWSLDLGLSADMFGCAAPMTLDVPLYAARMICSNVKRRGRDMRFSNSCKAWIALADRVTFTSEDVMVLCASKQSKCGTALACLWPSTGLVKD